MRIHIANRNLKMLCYYVAYKNKIMYDWNLRNILILSDHTHEITRLRINRLLFRIYFT